MPVVLGMSGMTDIHDLLTRDVRGVVDDDPVAVQTKPDADEVEDELPAATGGSRSRDVDARNDQRRAADTADPLELAVRPERAELADLASPVRQVPARPGLREWLTRGTVSAPGRGR
ncbi:hypothetical protein ACH4U5_31355 [Streptomyces sp. NPDC020858]|uniref:hypothetical protein n=1 Tax=Streptomyces sp. NPDC020858 TaxID=3365097 RepID=UPI0037AEDC20